MRIVDKNGSQMIYHQSIHNCLADAIGSAGLVSAVYETALARAVPALDQLRVWRQSRELPLLALPSARSDLEALKPIAER